MNQAVMALLVLALVSPEPQSSTGTIRGTVTSKSTGERIVHAEVSLYPPTFTTYTDSNGVYRLSKVPAGNYRLTISAPGYARVTFQGLIVPLYTPLVLDAALGDSAATRDTTIVMKFVPPPNKRTLTSDKMMFYRPDSTIDYKIRIVNPANPSRGPRSFSIPDSLLRHK